MFQPISGGGLLMPLEFCDYRRRLTAGEQYAYDVLCRAVSERRRRVDIPGVRGIDMNRVLNAVFRDQAMLFYLSKEGISYALDSMGLTATWNFTVSDGEIGSMAREMGARLRKLPLSRQGTQLAYELRVHNLMQSMGIQVGSGSWEDHCIAGPLLFRHSVCEGASHLFRLLCCMGGIHSLCVYGSAQNTAGVAPHSWNLVQLGKTYAHADAYWDCLLQTGRHSGHCYTYFNLSDRQIGIDHIWADPFLPPCPEEKYSYFEMNHASVNSRAEYRALLHTAHRKQKRSVLARLGPELRVEECMQEVMAFPWGMGGARFLRSFHQTQRVLSVWMECAPH